METPSPRTLDVMLGWGSHISAAKCARATSPKPGRQASLLCSYPGHLGLHPAPGRGGAGMTIGLFLIANGNNLFSSVFWKKSLKRKSDAREATSGDANKTGKDTCKQRPIPRAALSLKQENSNPSFRKLLGNPGSLSFRTVEPTLCSRRCFLPFSWTPL